MPLNFQEIEKPKEPVEFFVKNTKARPLELEGEVLPELIRKVRCCWMRTAGLRTEAWHASMRMLPHAMGDATTSDKLLYTCTMPASAHHASIGSSQLHIMSNEWVRSPHSVCAGLPRATCLSGCFIVTPQCGDVKSGRIDVTGVERYLDANVLIFDRELLR